MDLTRPLNCLRLLEGVESAETVPTWQGKHTLSDIYFFTRLPLFDDKHETNLFTEVERV